VARWLLIAALALTGGADALAPLRRHVAEHRDGRAAWTVDFSRLTGDRSPLPIGVFDSGIGGLTVLEAILGLDAFDNKTLRPGPDGVPDFEGESFVYLGDQANMPYGNYPARGAEPYLRELILKDAAFLLGTRWRPSAGEAPRFDKPPVKAIVIGCNTATAYGLEDLRAAIREWGLDVPVIGIIEAGARAVAEQLPADGPPATVAVLATVGTCSSNAYPRAVARAAGLAGKPPPTVVQQGSVGMAGAIERNPAFVWTGEGPRPAAYEGPAPKPSDLPATLAGLGAEHLTESGGAIQLRSVLGYACYDTGKLLQENREQLERAPLKFLVLGCTHFPLAEREIAEALGRARACKPLEACVPGDVRFINPAEHTARELFRELARSRLRAKDAPAGRPLRFYVSVPDPGAPGIRLAADGSLDADYRTSRKPGTLDREDTVVVSLTAASLPESTRRLVQSLPAVWTRLSDDRAR
jgi:glutamate racemase